MPVIDIRYGDLRRLSGLERPAEWFIDNIPMIGASFEGSEDDVLRFEFFPNRPDHYSVEGLARTLRSMYSEKPYTPEYSVEQSGRSVEVHESVSKVRPVIVGSVVSGLTLDDSMLRSIIDLQEKLHLTVGRKRRKVAVGIHDMRNITFPLKYAAYGGNEKSFIPLGFSEEMTLSRIVEEHEKGREFGWILNGGPFPLITDAQGHVLSMPPIINGNITQLTDRTTDVFIDVTGTSFEACSGVLNIITTALADRGGSIHAVNISRGAEAITTPDLGRRTMRVKLREMKELMGVDVDADSAARLLTKMGHACSAGESELSAGIPAYRMDILHPVDLIEDAAISYGFGRFGQRGPMMQTVGSLSRSTTAEDALSELLIGYGYAQVVTFMISGMQFEKERMRLEEVRSVDILNPITEDRNMLRTSLLPGMLLLLEANKHNELPQRIFETGDVHNPGRRKSFAALSIHPRAAFSECRSLADAINRDMKCSLTFGGSADRRFIEGRQMSIMLEGERVGVLGELHPEVITNFNLFNPIAAVEFDLESVLKLR